MAFDLKTFKTRSITAIVFVAILLSAIILHYYTFLILFFVVAILSLKEFYDLSEKMGVKPFKALGFLLGGILFLGLVNSEIEIIRFHEMIYLLLLIPFVIAIQFVFSESQTALSDFTYTIAGIVYCIIPFSLLVCLPFPGGNHFELNELNKVYQPFSILGIVFLIWANDTFAYIGGSIIGKNKMLERVSPGKTWEGTFVGVIFAVALGFLFNKLEVFSQHSYWPAVGLMVGVLGTLGDLVESWMKRKAGVKDSGAIMPGHGGILDRFDSLMFVTPFVFVMLRMFGS